MYCWLTEFLHEILYYKSNTIYYPKLSSIFIYYNTSLGTSFPSTLLIEINNNCMRSYHNSPFKEMSAIKPLWQNVSISGFKQV